MAHKTELKLRGRPEPRFAAIRKLPREVVPHADGGETVAAAAERPYRVSVSSEEPVLRTDWYGDSYWEVLGHQPGEADLSRFIAGGAIRDTHWGEQVGSVANPALENGALLVDAGFMSSQKGQEYQRGVEEGHIQNVSLGYDIVGAAVPNGMGADGVPIYRFRWVAHHMAMVPDPADKSVGFGRDGEGVTGERTIPVQTQGNAPKEGQMLIRNKPKMDEVPGDEPRGGGAAASVTVLEERKTGAQLERQRTKNIIDLCDNWEIDPTLRDQWIEDGTPYEGADGVSAKVRAIRTTRGKTQPSAEQVDANGHRAGKAIVNVPEKDRKHYAVTRALHLAAHPDLKRDGLEGELSTEIVRSAGPQVRRSGKENAVFIPLRLGDLRPEMIEQQRTVDSLRALRGRAMGSTVAGGGAELVYERPGELVEKLVPRSVLLSLGAGLTTDLNGPMSWPKELSDVDGYWTSENPPSPVADTEMDFGLINAIARSLMTTMYWSKQWERQASIDVENRAQNRMAGKIARMLDIGLIQGDGTAGTVLGLLNTPGVHVPSWSPLSGIPTKAQLENMMGEVADVEGDTLGTQAFLTTTPMAFAFRGKPLESGMPIYMWNGTRFNGNLVDFPAQGSAHVPQTLSTDYHGLIFGDFSQIEVLTWGAVEAVLDGITLARWAQRRLTLFLMADGVNKYPEAFAKANVKPN
ncbi:MAG TPA: phage major capsid protein [Polyangia bacterium]|nr:phage major capsid protein [Polyangia bacterium]